MNTYNIPAQHCAQCNAAIECSSGIGKEQHSPQPGDISICSKCGFVMQFSENLKLSPFTEEQLKELGQTDFETYQLITSAVLFVKSVRTSLN